MTQRERHTPAGGADEPLVTPAPHPSPAAPAADRPAALVWEDPRAPRPPAPPRAAPPPLAPPPQRRSCLDAPPLPPAPRTPAALDPRLDARRRDLAVLERLRALAPNLEETRARHDDLRARRGRVPAEVAAAAEAAPAAAELT